jgi:hypothetical protein
MRPHALHRCTLVLATVVYLTCIPFVPASDEPSLNKDQIKQFLLAANVVSSRHTSKGITSPWRLTLSDGTLTHDARFQTIDEHKTEMKSSTGRTELNFVDSYKYDIAAYRLAELLDLDDLLPVTVERKWQGNSGALSWWLPVMMDEVERHKQRLTAPDAEDWNNQMYKIRIFDQLVYDTDANLTNVLIGHDWKIWRIDFTRAFRLYKDLQDPKDLVRCDRHLLEKLKALDGNELSERTKHYLTKDEVKALMTRRDKVVAYFQKRISQKGESEVLY